VVGSHVECAEGDIDLLEVDMESGRESGHIVGEEEDHRIVSYVEGCAEEDSGQFHHLRHFCSSLDLTLYSLCIRVENLRS